MILLLNEEKVDDGYKGIIMKNHGWFDSIIGMVLGSMYYIWVAVMFLIAICILTWPILKMTAVVKWLMY